MRFEVTSIAGVAIVEIEPHVDERGAFARTFCATEFAAAGLPTAFPQSNLSINHRQGTLRGMHYSDPTHGESKLVRCVRGAVFDVVADTRPGAATWGRWLGVELSADNRRALFVPSGVAHGFLTLVDDTDVYYHMGSEYRPEVARGFRWDDPSVGIEWPAPPVVISDADRGLPFLDPDGGTP